LVAEIFVTTVAIMYAGRIIELGPAGEKLVAKYGYIGG